MQALWYVPSILTVALVAAGVSGSFLQLLAPERGFWIFVTGLFVAAITLPALAGAAAFASATGRPWRRSAVRAALLPLLAVLGILLPNLARVNPPIHDITTDPQDSLAFPPDVAARRDASLGAEPPREQVLAQQREHYGDLAPLELSLPSEQAFAAALSAAEQMPRWEVRVQDAASGHIEAVASSLLFGFRDDVLIRVQAGESGSRIDVRSRSRYGESDLGANAQRIRAYLQQVRRVAAG
jgi:uncharacterized protein (DUF1499 family)